MQCEEHKLKTKCIDYIIIGFKYFFMQRSRRKGQLIIAALKKFRCFLV